MLPFLFLFTSILVLTYYLIPINSISPPALTTFYLLSVILLFSTGYRPKPKLITFRLIIFYYSKLKLTAIHFIIFYPRIIILILISRPFILNYPPYLSSIPFYRFLLLLFLPFIV